MRKILYIACLAAEMSLAWAALFMQYGGMEGKDSIQTGDGDREEARRDSMQADGGDRGKEWKGSMRADGGGRGKEWKNSMRADGGGGEKDGKCYIDGCPVWDGPILTGKGGGNGRHGGKKGIAGTRAGAGKRAAVSRILPGMAGTRAGVSPGSLVKVFQGEGIGRFFGAGDDEGISYISFCQEWRDGKDGARPVTTVRVVKKN